MKVYKNDDVLGIILQENNDSDMVFMAVFEEAVDNKDKYMIESGFIYLKHLFVQKYPDIQRLLCCNVLKIYSETNEEALIILFSDKREISPKEMVNFANYMDCNPITEEMTIDYSNGKLCLENNFEVPKKRHLYELDYIGRAFDISESVKGSLVENNGKYFIDSDNMFLGEYLKEVPYTKCNTVCDLDKLRDNEIELE